MRYTLQNRFAEAEVETVAAEKKKVERETLAEKMLNEQELILDATKERSKMLEQQVRENAKVTTSCVHERWISSAIFWIHVLANN